jgi:murein DD-endopeptidase MepM/ murein hydrolase activator NlpD
VPWRWPLSGPVVARFHVNANPYVAGQHRGIDIAAPVGTPVVAAAAGVVSFAGPVGGRLFVTIDHGGGLESTCSFLSSIAVHRGDTVAQGQVIAASGTGHVGDTIPNLHFGVRLNDAYVDPLDYLGPIDVWRFIRLAPLDTSRAA